MKSQGLLLTFEFPPHPGGIGTYAYQIGTNLHNMGVPIEVLARPSIDEQLNDRDFDRMQRLPIYRYRRWKSQTMSAIGRTAETLLFVWRHRPRWIFCCSYKAAYAALACKLLFGIPYYLIGHGSDYSRASWFKAVVLSQAQGLLANSHYTATLMKMICKRPIEVIPLGADTVQFQLLTDARQCPELQEQYQIHGQPILLSVGRLNPRKGHDITLEALKQICKEYPNIQLLIVGKSMPGEEAYSAMLHDYVERHRLTRNVTFIPMVSQDELRRFYALADVFILSSRNAGGDVEGFGIVLIEANLMQVPVIAAKSGGIADAVEDGKTGLLFESENATDLATKLKNLLSNETLRREMGEYGRERALRDYNWQVVANKTLQYLFKSSDGLIQLADPRL